jgi:hypothetical protein
MVMRPACHITQVDIAGYGTGNYEISPHSMRTQVTRYRIDAEVSICHFGIQVSPDFTHPG